MLRSFDYAARTAARRREATIVAADAWAASARSAFLRAYGPLTPGEEAALAVFELEKACYEVRYEANNRPDWTWLPLDATTSTSPEAATSTSSPMARWARLVRWSRRSRAVRMRP